MKKYKTNMVSRAAYFVSGYLAFRTSQFLVDNFSNPFIPRMNVIGVAFFFFIVAAVIGQLARNWEAALTKISLRESLERCHKILENIFHKEPVEPFFLYLRPFHITLNLPTENPHTTSSQFFLNSNQPNFTDWESLFSEIVEYWAPMVALGRPLAVLGADRIKTSDETWEKVFAVLADTASVIFIVPSGRNSSKWELEWLKVNQQLSKCIFLMPEKFDKTHYPKLEEDWDEITLSLAEIGLSLPEYDEDGAAFKVCSDGVATDIRGPLIVRKIESARNVIGKLYPKIDALEMAIGKDSEELEQLLEVYNRDDSRKEERDVIRQILDKRKHTEEMLEAEDIEGSNPAEISIVKSYLHAVLNNQSFDKYLSPEFSDHVIYKKEIHFCYVLNGTEDKVFVRLYYVDSLGIEKPKTAEFRVVNGLIEEINVVNLNRGGWEPAGIVFPLPL